MMSDHSYQMYLDDLKAIRACGDAEIEKLLKLIAQGPAEQPEVQAAKVRLIEGLQHFIVELAGKQKDQGVAVSDLIQESNVALLMAIAEYETGAAVVAELEAEASLTVAAACKKRVEELAEAQMKELIEEQKHENTAHEELIARINVLQKVSQMLSEELKREPTVAELAAKMKMTEDEIQDIMKETLAAMSVSPDAEAAEESENMDDLEDFASMINSNSDSKYES
jgi:RNA polymerase primary sigma factor